MPGAQARPPSWRRRGYSRPLRTGRTARIIGLPPGDLIKQVRFGPAMHGRCGQHRVLELLILSAPERALGQEPLGQPLQGQRINPADPAPVQRVPGEAKEDLAGEGVVQRVQRRKLARQLKDVSVASKPVEQDPAGGHGVPGSGPLPGWHTTTVGHNHRSPAAFPADARRRSVQRSDATRPLHASLPTSCVTLANRLRRHNRAENDGHGDTRLVVTRAMVE